jgi:hypothetical protein
VGGGRGLGAGEDVTDLDRVNKPENNDPSVVEPIKLATNAA